MRYLYRYCICCETYKKIEVDNRLYKDLKRFGLLHGESKIFTICKFFSSESISQEPSVENIS